MAVQHMNAKHASEMNKLMCANREGEEGLIVSFGFGSRGIFKRRQPTPCGCRLRWVPTATWCARQDVRAVHPSVQLAPLGLRIDNIFRCSCPVTTPRGRSSMLGRLPGPFAFSVL
jgi:hypothetical protein